MIKAYWRAHKHGLNISVFDMIFMLLRGSKPIEIINAAILLKDHNIEIDRIYLEAHNIATGNVANLVETLIYVRNKNIDLEFKSLVKAGMKHSNMIPLIDKLIEQRKLHGPKYLIEEFRL